MIQVVSRDHHITANEKKALFYMFCTKSIPFFQQIKKTKTRQNQTDAAVLKCSVDFTDTLESSCIISRTCRKHQALQLA